MIRLFMRAFLLSIGLLLVALTLDASNYRVVSRNALNVREGAGTDYVVIGKLTSKDTVYVIKIDNNWAQIKYQDKKAYVSSKYIIPMRSNQKKSAKEFFQGIGALFYEGPISYLPLLIISTLLLTILLPLILKHDLTRIIILYAGIIGVCVMEFVFFIAYKGDPWFCYPDNVGWVWAIINFLLYGFALSLQIGLGILAIKITCCDNNCNFQVGMYSYVAVVVLGIIFWLANVDMAEYLLYGFIIAQIVQIIINFRSIKHFWRAFMVSFLFILVCFAVIVSAFYFIAMLILICIVIFLAFFFLDAFTAGLKNSSVTHHYH